MREAHVGRGERGRVVDAVADHAGDHTLRRRARARRRPCRPAARWPRTSRMPTAARDRVRRLAVVAGQHDDVDADRGEQPAHGVARRRPYRVAPARSRRARGRPRATPTIDLPCASSARIAARRRIECLAARRRRAQPSVVAVAIRADAAETPRPGVDTKSRIGQQRDALARAPPRRSPAQADASIPARGSPHACRTSSSARSSKATTSVTSGRPSVSVPVLSTIKVCRRPACSSAAALRMRMP